MKAKILFLMLAIAGFILVTGTAQASLLVDHVDADGVQDSLLDTSRAMWDDNDGNGDLSVGDAFYGWAAVSGIIPDSGSSYAGQPDRIIIVFSAKISALNGTTFSLDFNDTGTHDLASLTGGRALSNRSGASGDEIAVIVGGPNPVGAISPGAFIAGEFGLAKYDYEATIGLVDDGVGGEDFFEADFSGSALERNERGGFTVMDASGSYGNSINMLPVTGIANFAGAAKAPEVGLLGSILGGRDNYDYSDTSDFFINPVPEPASMAVWAAGLLCFAGASLRRRKK